MNNNKTQNNDYSYDYACISCLQPTPRLYKQYSTKHNIRLEQCTKCAKDVDKYIEYELLLKLMDVVLFRKLAYRHLLFNNKTRICNTDTINNMDTIASNDDSEQGYVYHDCFHTTNTFLYFLLIISLRSISIILFLQGIPDIPELVTSTAPQAQEQSQTLNDQNEQRFKLLELWGFLLPFLFGSISIISIMMEYFVSYIGTFLSTKFILHCIKGHIHKSSQIQVPTENATPIWRELCLALFLPPLFQSVTLFVHIFSYEYEEQEQEMEHQQSSQNTVLSSTAVVQLLGSTFIFGFTYMAVHCVVERRLHAVLMHDTAGESSCNKRVHKNSMHRLIISFSNMIPGWPFLFGLGLKIIILPQFLSLLRMILLAYGTGSTDDITFDFGEQQGEQGLLLLQCNLSLMMINRHYYGQKSISGFVYQWLVDN